MIQENLKYLRENFNNKFDKTFRESEMLAKTLGIAHSMRRIEAVAQRCSVKKVVLRNYAKFTRKHLCQILFFNKVDLINSLNAKVAVKLTGFHMIVTLASNELNSVIPVDLSVCYFSNVLDLHQDLLKKYSTSKVFCKDFPLKV